VYRIKRDPQRPLAVRRLLPWVYLRHGNLLLAKTHQRDAELCGDDKSTFVVSAKGYATLQATCTSMGDGDRGQRQADLLRPYALRGPCQAEWVDGSESGHRVEWPRRALSAGPDFQQLKTYRRCPTN